MKKYIIASLILLSVNIAFAQDFFDALKFSQTEYGGTARSIAMGSAFGALGGDFVSASINPAGLGFYRTGEFVISPTLNLNQKEASYLGNNEINDRYNFNFNNAGYVAAINTGAETGIVSFTFGVGYNRLKNFNSNSLIQGYGAKTTLLNYFTDYANQSPNENQFDYHYEGLAWNSYLIDEDLDPNVIEGIYYNDLTDYRSYNINDANGNYIGTGYEAIDVYPHRQKSVVQRNGHLDEYLISLGLNINHKLYIGTSLGMVDLEYYEKNTFSEYDNENFSDYLSDYSLETRLSESGFGINFKTGIIYRPIKSLRIGIAFHTPTFYDISKYEKKDINSNFDQEVGVGDKGTQWSDENTQEYDYKLETPLKTNLSMAYSIGDVAILSADYELINYGNAKFRNSGDNYDYSDQNSDISKTLNNTGILRIGGEYRLSPTFSLRGGLNLMGNPWKDSFTYSDGTTSAIENSSDTFRTYSAGFGYRQKNFFIDFAYRINQYNYAYKIHEIYYTNPTNGSSVASIKELNNQATITFGLRF